MINPVGDLVAIKPSEAKKKTSGGVILPDQSQERPDRGTVVAVGPGYVTEKGVRVAPQVQVGDTVLYPKHGGHKIAVGDEEYLLLHERDLFGVLNEQK